MSRRPSFSTLVALVMVLVAALLSTMAVLMDVWATPRSSKTIVTVRLWDRQVAAAYRQSFAVFTRAHPDIEVRTNFMTWRTYFDTLRTDVAAGNADDIFLLDDAHFAGYADNGRLMDIGRILGPGAASAWKPAVVEEFTRGGVLWGVPQMTDGGTAVYYNADLLAAAGVDPAQLDSLRWSPNSDDTLRALLARLTVDIDGHVAGTPGFDGSRVRQWGYNAADNPVGIYLNYIGSAGGIFQHGDEFAFDNPAAIEAFRYIVGLINDDHVSPPASDTNNNLVFPLSQFLAGRVALYQSGTYHLSLVFREARFHWGVAMMPIGPAGRVSVTTGAVASGNSASKHPDAVRQVLAWMGSADGNAFVGRNGAAVPAVRSAQSVYFDYWTARGVDVTPFFTVLDGRRIPAPGGAGFPAGNEALKPYFDEMFLGRSDVATTLRRAQAAANAAARR
jgi:multiple sugar transport system substrate-binding protein